jgi:tRNA threonylcarbamoyl adenosine modification protein YeaZ
MKTLLLETSSEYALLAVIERGRLSYELRLPGGQELSKRLGAEVETLLKSFPPPYDRVVIGTGPGSFTGTRVGAALGNALAFGWKIPLYTVSSLTGFGPGTVAIDARMGGIYVQTEFDAPQLLSLSEASAFLPKQPSLASPHPEKILARIPGLRLEHRKPDPLLLLKHAVPASHPLKIAYFGVEGKSPFP